MHYILSDEDQITYNLIHPYISFLFLSYHGFYRCIYVFYTVHDPRQSALLTSERNVHVYLLYPYSDSYSILFQSFPLFLEELLFQKLSAVLPQCRPPKYFTIVSDYDLRPLHAQIRSFSVFLIPKAGRGSVACPRHLPFGSRNRSWT